MDQLERLLAAGLPTRWAAFDEVYGRSEKLRKQAAKAGLAYAAIIPCDYHVTLPSGTVIRADDAVKDAAFERRSCGNGSKGPRYSDWAMTATSIEGQSLLIRRPISRPEQLTFYLCLDLHMPVLDGIAATRRLTAEHPGVAIVVLTTYVDDNSVLDALRAGARSYLTKDADRTDIARVLQAAAGGLTVFDPRVHDTLLAAAAGPASLTNPEIVERLYLSNHTVKTHINRIFAKTGSRDRAAAIGYAHRHDIG
jgi:DNA-binding NarL/FixJ family response regulator